MKCPICSDEFEPKRSDAKVCAKAACRKRMQRLSKLTPSDQQLEQSKPDYYKFSEESWERKCLNCNKKFTTQLELNKFCSTECKQKTLDKLVEQMRERGDKNASRGSEVTPITFISSGVAEIDAMTGGFPRGKVSEVYGRSGVGKSALMFQLLKGMANNQTVLYVDVEQAYNQSFAKQIGTNLTNLNVSTLNILEEVANEVENSLETGVYDAIVVDSIAAMVPRAEAEGEVGEALMGLKARLMGQFMRRNLSAIEKAKVALIFINQERESMNSYGAPKFTPGGMAVPYAASLRLVLTSNKADRIVKEKETTGHWITAEVTKSRVCKPYQKTRFKLLYE